MSYNFLRRSPLKKKPRAHKVSAPWRTPRIRLDGKEIGALRSYIWDRSNGQCENSLPLSALLPGDYVEGTRCAKRISWYSGEMAHMKIAHTRSDSKETVLFVCKDCHYEDTRNRNKLKPHRDWQP